MECMTCAYEFLTDDEWNCRPEEDRLRARIADLEDRARAAINNLKCFDPGWRSLAIDILSAGLAPHSTSTPTMAEPAAKLLAILRRLIAVGCEASDSHGDCFCYYCNHTFPKQDGHYPYCPYSAAKALIPDLTPSPSPSPEPERPPR